MSSEIPRKAALRIPILTKLPIPHFRAVPVESEKRETELKTLSTFQPAWSISTLDDPAQTAWKIATPDGTDFPLLLWQLN